MPKQYCVLWVLHWTARSVCWELLGGLLRDPKYPTGRSKIRYTLIISIVKIYIYRCTKEPLLFNRKGKEDIVIWTTSTLLCDHLVSSLSWLRYQLSLIEIKILGQDIGHRVWAYALHVQGLRLIPVTEKTRALSSVLLMASKHHWPMEHQTIGPRIKPSGSLCQSSMAGNKHIPKRLPFMKNDT